ncbi:phosphate signaling complex protein PhoU [Marinicella sp. W31]|uniref:phosphate signaling complex protein PhoU n=1 Tax=Marinicella sp. W31 TaxID=3023713 RepID=UPI003756A386
MEHIEFDQHTSQEYNTELEAVRNSLLNMGGKVEKQLRKAMQSLLQSDEKLAQKVIARDLTINALEVQIDEECTRIIARRQPAASDLRLIIAVIKCITDLERIGDEAEKIARIAEHLAQKKYHGKFYKELEELATAVSANLTKTLNAMARLDADRALLTAEADDLIDQQFDDINALMIKHMVNHADDLKNVLKLSWCARSLERIGDHAKNICEYVIYLIKGKDIRHIDLETIRDEYFD